MGNKITTIVTTSVILIIFLFMVAFITQDSQLTESKRVINSLVADMQYNGYITVGQYTSVIDSIPVNDGHLEFTINSGTDTKIENASSTAETAEMANSYNDIVFNSSFVEALASQGVYEFNPGDKIQVKLVSSTSNLFNILSNTFTKTSSSGYKVIAQADCVVVNNKYNVNDRFNSDN